MNQNDGLLDKEAIQYRWFQMKIAKLAYVLIAFLLSCVQGEPDGEIGGDRPARVILPSDYDETKSYPLVTLLHGYTATGEFQDMYLHRLSERVDERQFILVIPDGKKDKLGQQYWNASDACCDFYNAEPDDQGYLLSLLDETIEKYSVNDKQVYYIGHSNGAFMSYTMACEFGDRIAGLVSLSGTTYLDESKCPENGNPSVLHIHGTADTTISYKGAAHNLTLNGYLGAQETTQRWAKRNNCISKTTIAEKLNISTLVPGRETEVETWLGCDDQREVTLWTIKGGGHTPLLTTTFNDRVLDFLFSNPQK